MLSLSITITLTLGLSTMGQTLDNEPPAVPASQHVVIVTDTQECHPVPVEVSLVKTESRYASWRPAIVLDELGNLFN